MIEVASLTKAYGQRLAVQDLTFQVAPGEVYALLGPNGAGKTTTFYMMVGFIRPTGGRIFLKGREISQLPMYRRARLGLGYLPQEPSAFRRMTVLENLLAVLEFQPLSRAERLEKAKALLEELAIYHLKDQMAYALSGGERRRLEMARALCTDPDFILLDEPFTGVDPKNVKEIQKVIAELRERRGVGVFITDHAVRETLAITDRVYVMYDGQILFHGDPDTFARDQGVRRHYLGEDYEL